MGKTFRRCDDLGSEAWDKQTWHQRYRRKCKTITDGPAPSIREVSNPWCMNKDGKCLFSFDVYFFDRNTKISKSRRRWLQKHPSHKSHVINTLGAKEESGDNFDVDAFDFE